MVNTDRRGERPGWRIFGWTEWEWQREAQLQAVSKKPPRHAWRDSRGGFFYVLEILEPVASPGFESGKPAAGEIEQEDGDRPNQVEKGKRPDVAFRRFGIAHGMVGQEPGTDEAEADLRDHKGECVDQRDVEHVIEEGNASEKDDSACDTAVEAFDQRDQSDDGPQRHQQEIERRRVLAGVQK